MTNDAGLGYLGKALELRYRLPKLYNRVVRLEVPVWKAFKVADQTISLSMDAATAVDTAIAQHLHTCSWAQVDRAIDAARAAHDPEEAERLRLIAAEQRHATVYLDDAGTTGTVDVRATLDTADALDLEARPPRRRPDAGRPRLHRHPRRTPIPRPGRDGQGPAGAGSRQARSPGRRGPPGEASRSTPTSTPTASPHIDNTQTPALIEQIREWCETAGTKVTVKPVIDLNDDLETTAYVPTDRIREHVRLRDRSCVFPDCGRRRVDLDHIHPHATGGPTTTDNLAMLCRRHHRAKTHGHWHYEMTEPAPLRMDQPHRRHLHRRPDADDPDRPDTPPPTGRRGYGRAMARRRSSRPCSTR